MIDRVLEPRLGQCSPPAEMDGADSAGVQVSKAEKRAVLIAAAAVLVFGVLLVTAWLLPGSPLRGEGGSLIPSPMLSNLVVVISASFLIMGFVYSQVLPLDRTNARSVR